MSTFTSIKTFADEVKSEVQSVDYVLLNAGLTNKDFKMGEEGYEETLMVNCLGTAMLAVLLLPWMKEKGRRGAHFGGCDEWVA